MRQRTMAPTPQEYDPQEEESLGIPTTIEVPADALSVDPEPRIPLKIEVTKVRAPKNSKSNKSKGSSRRRTAAQYDEYLYGSGTAPPVELKQWTAAEAAPTASSTASTTTAASNSTSVMREGKDLVAIGSFLANGARQASQRAERQALLLPQLQVDNKKRPPTTRGKNTGTGTRRDSFTRSSSVPSVMQGVNAREAVDFFQDPKRPPPPPRQTSVQAQAPREIEIGLDLPGTAPAASPPSPTIPATRRPPQRHPSLAGQSSMSMIFQVAAASAGASTSNASTGPPKKQLSNRSMQTTSTHTVLTTSSHPHMSASSNSCTSTTPHHLQDYSAHVGYVMEDSSSRLVDLPPTKPPRYNQSKTFQVPKEWEYPLPPTNSTTTATTAWMEGEDETAPPFSQQHNKPSNKARNNNKKWKNLFPRKSMTSLTRR